MTEETNVHRFPGRLRTVRQPSPAELLVGITDDLAPLAKGANEQTVLSIINRIEAVAERLVASKGDPAA